MNMNTNATLPLGRYRHFKGMEYEVLGSATHSESREHLVVYRALYGSFGLFVRPQAMFLEQVTRGGITQPRFSFIGPSAVRKLTREAQMHARAFLLAEARPLEAALYRMEFEGAPASEVFTALAAFQNDDGGFGHALEPDWGAPASSVLATTTALQHLRHLDAPADHPLVRSAMGWLLRAFDADKMRWPLIPALPTNAPHAPWWTPGPEHPTWFRQYAVNPRAEILGYLHHWPALADPAIVETVEADLTRHYTQSTDALDMNELLCTLRLLDVATLPAPLRDAARAAAQRSLDVTLARDSVVWESYALQPLHVAPIPLALFAPALAELLAANLDFCIAAQQDDGSWAPQWSWSEQHPDAWPAARRAWQGVLTLEAMRSLRAYGRLAL